MTRKRILKVNYNYNYTISIIIKNSYTIRFRDILGSDLEFYQTFYDSDEELTYTDKYLMLQHICLSNLRKVPYAWIEYLFAFVSREIFKNYIDKVTWLKASYAIQNGRFINPTLENEPMTKFIAMCDIHKDHVSKIQTG